MLQQNFFVVIIFITPRLPPTFVCRLWKAIFILKSLMKLDTFTFYLFLHCEYYIVTVCLVGGLVFAESWKESHFSPDSTVPMLLQATLNIFLKLQGF